jgi:hypothetical protein
MKRCERCSGRGFDSRQVHHKEIKMIRYDSSKDRSEEFGWKKVCDEHVPTEEEQRFWSNVIIVFAVSLIGITLIFL